MEKIKKEFIKDCIRHLNEYTRRVKICLDLLSEEQVWQKPNEASNSVANLMLHLCGNMTQYVLSSLGGKADLRERHKEFSAKDGLSKEQLFEKLSAVVHSVIEEIQIHDEESLLKTKTVQGFEKNGIAIILHVTEHYSYHTGQIALLTKLMTNQDLGFYKGLDLNKKNVL
ncbi:MAG: DUF1572 domain-containing protein [Chitinophagaceae bacterium]|nr:DUF1572 domain-containing protein [Chitinophagaceae bacterium]